ncbi:hypothetical protein CesoFtcFv8_026601 [Champsocephalus esox]|uniref:Uncharacterized protein n=1 Tax=Champsocephalus esox TaxID=159716 RepID=A0AAN8G438_9TELE|nr:hypothetical protein CesoFtcFv8_026601 [Champsocephalus esox]
MSTYIGAPSAREVRESKAREASSHSRVFLILLPDAGPLSVKCRYAAPSFYLLTAQPDLTSLSLSVHLYEHNHISTISQQQLRN